MRATFLAFLKKHATVLLMVGGVGAYILISGTTGTCGACVAITQELGIPSLIPGAQAAEPVAEAAQAPASKEDPEAEIKPLP